VKVLTPTEYCLLSTKGWNLPEEDTTPDELRQLGYFTTQQNPHGTGRFFYLTPAGERALRCYEAFLGICT